MSELSLPPLSNGTASDRPPPLVRSRGRRRILVVLFLIRCGLRFAIQRIVGRLLPASYRTARARAVRAEMQRLGGLWVKLGQIVALRPDLFGQEISRELADLLDRVEAVPFEEIADVFRDEVGADPDEVFASVEPTALAAGSIGQVHRATDRTGREVVIKVQRMDAQRLFSADLRLLRQSCMVLRVLHVMPSARWSELLWEVTELVRTELDYRFEVANLRGMRERLATHGIVVPRVNTNLSTVRVVTMEFMPGVTLSDYIRAVDQDPSRVRTWREENGIDPTTLAWRLYETHTRQVYQDNYFHGDLHPGNVMICRGNLIGLIDFGAAGSLDSTRLRKYYMLFDAVYTRDFSKVADIFLVLAPSVPVSRTAEVKEDIVRAMRVWQTNCSVPSLPYHQRSLTFAMTKVAAIFRRHGIPITWDFMQVNRAELTMDLSMAYLMPQANFYELIDRYRREARLDILAQSLDHQEWLSMAEDLRRTVGLPAAIADSAEYDVEWVRQRAINFTDDLRSVSILSRGLLTVTLAAAWAATTALALGLTGRWVSWPLGRAATTVVTDVWPGAVHWPTWQWALGFVISLYPARVLGRAHRRARS